MAETNLPLGQVRPPAATLTTLYTVPAGTSVVISSIVICNDDPVATTFRLSHQLLGAADATKQYLFRDQVIPGLTTLGFTLGITMQATDVLKCFAALATVNFHVYGVQITP